MPSPIHLHGDLAELGLLCAMMDDAFAQISVGSSYPEFTQKKRYFRELTSMHNYISIWGFRGLDVLRTTVYEPFV